jgi:hypothetical protein
MGNRVYKEVPGTPDVKRRYIVDIVGKLPTILCVIDADDGSLERSYIYASGDTTSIRLRRFCQRYNRR